MFLPHKLTSLQRLCSVFGVVLFTAFAQAESSTALPKALEDVSIKENLGASVSLDAIQLRNEDGRVVPLSQYFKKGRPVLLTLVYYGCPHLCGLVLNGVIDGMRDLDWTPGNQFDVVTVSIDPREDAEMAKQKKESTLKAYGRANAAAGWHFLTGTEEHVRRLAREVGFGYKWDPVDQQYAHGAVIFMLTPEGKVSRYLYGVQYRPRDLKLALLEAGEGKVGTVAEKFLLFCFSYNPEHKGYSLALSRIMRGAGAGTVFLFGGYLGVFWTRQARRQKKKGKDDLTT